MCRPGRSSTGSRLIVARAAPVTMLVAPAPPRRCTRRRPAGCAGGRRPRRCGPFPARCGPGGRGRVRRTAVGPDPARRRCHDRRSRSSRRRIAPAPVTLHLLGGQEANESLGDGRAQTAPRPRHLRYVDPSSLGCRALDRRAHRLDLEPGRPGLASTSPRPVRQQVSGLVDEAGSVADALTDRPPAFGLRVPGVLRPDPAHSVDLGRFIAVAVPQLVQAAVVELQRAACAVDLDYEVTRPPGQPLPSRTHLEPRPESEQGRGGIVVIDLRPLAVNQYPGARS